MKVGGQNKETFLPGEGPLGRTPGICNYDINPLSAAAMLSLRVQGTADPLVVVIKLHAEENMATCLRIKRAESSCKAKGKGADMLTKRNQMH